MQERVTNHRLKWEFSQCSPSLMGHHSSPIRKVSAKRFPPEMVDNRRLAKKHSLSRLISPQEEAHYSHTAQSRKQAFISQMGMNDYSAVSQIGRFSESEDPRNPAHNSHTEFETNLVPTSE
jgi:hypothetical protein